MGLAIIVLTFVGLPMAVRQPAYGRPDFFPLLCPPPSAIYARPSMCPLLCAGHSPGSARMVLFPEISLPRLLFSSFYFCSFLLPIDLGCCAHAFAVVVCARALTIPRTRTTPRHHLLLSAWTRGAAWTSPTHATSPRSQSPHTPPSRTERAA